MRLSGEEYKELQVIFKPYCINHDNFDEPINPLKYVEADGDTCLHHLAWARRRWGSELRAADATFNHKAPISR